MSFRAKMKRIAFIHSRLRNLADYPSSKELAQGLEEREGEEPSTRTIQRDIEWMRDEGAPIEYEQSRHGYYYSHTNWQLPAMTLTEGDLLALMVADRALAGYRNSPFYSKLKDVFERLTHLLPEKVTLTSQDLAADVSVIADPVTSIDEIIWNTLRNGLESQTSVFIQYQAPGYTTSADRVVDPLHIIGHRGEWYLLCWSHHNKDVRVYALNRIRLARDTRKSFNRPPNFKAEDYIDPNFGVFVNEGDAEIEVCFTGQAAVKIQERSWHPGQRIEQHSDGTITLRFLTNQRSQLLFWVSQWGPEAEILSPPELRARAKERFVATAALYS
jgi:proteasome accessory factor B